MGMWREYVGITAYLFLITMTILFVYPLIDYHATTSMKVRMLIKELEQLLTFVSIYLSNNKITTRGSYFEQISIN